MPAELDVAPVTFTVKARPVGQVGVNASRGATVILVPVPGGEGPRGPAGNNAPVFNETPAGDQDGINTVFTTANVFQVGSTRVHRNGLREELGTCYTESGPGEITFDEPPLSTDYITLDYLIQ